MHNNCMSQIEDSYMACFIYKPSSSSNVRSQMRAEVIGYRSFIGINIAVYRGYFCIKVSSIK